MKIVSILVVMTFLFNGCSPNVDVGVPMGNYGVSNVSIGSSGNIRTNVNANVGFTNVNTNF